MKLSILICSLEKRHAQLQSLLEEIETQILLCDATAIIEVITEVDNKQITTGAKRNNLLNLILLIILENTIFLVLLLQTIK